MAAVRVISNKALREFAARSPEAEGPLQAWRKIVEKTHFEHFASLKRTFNSVDRVGHFYVFDIAGNRYRIVAAIHFNTQSLYVRHVFTHAQYDKWKPPS